VCGGVFPPSHHSRSSSPRGAHTKKPTPGPNNLASEARWGKRTKRGLYFSPVIKSANGEGRMGPGSSSSSSSLSSEGEKPRFGRIKITGSLLSPPTPPHIPFGGERGEGGCGEGYLKVSLTLRSPDRQGKEKKRFGGPPHFPQARFYLE
jgi:hypothetical protein